MDAPIRISDREKRFIVGVAAMMILVCASMLYLVEQQQIVRTQSRLVKQIHQVGGFVEYHDDRCPIPYWLVRSLFGQTIYSVRSIVFDFEDKPQTELLPFAEFDVFQDLERFDVTLCNVTGNDLKFLERLPRLRSAQLGYIELGPSGFMSLSKCRALEEVNLCETDVDDDKLRLVARITTLKRLCLSGRNQITDRGLVNLATLSQLEALSLNDEAITDEGLQAIRQFAHLTALDICNTQIKGPGLKWLAQCPELRNLRMFHLRDIDDECMRILGKFSSLESLCISDCPVTETGLSELTGLKNLKLLFVCNTSITPEQAMAFQSRMPKLEAVRTRF